MPSPPSLRSKRSSAADVFAIRPYSRTLAAQAARRHRDDNATVAGIVLRDQD
jgi:hypothetical protein